MNELAAIFNLEQLALCNTCLQKSETAVSQFFKIPELPSKQYPYEMLTACQLAENERAPHAFAHLVVYERPRLSGIEQLYRICLQDDVILASPTVQTEAGGLSSLLVYVLTHELVHVVRFQRAEQSFLASEESRAAEEDVVHLLTLEVLKLAAVPSWRELAARYGNPVGPVQKVSGE